MLEWLRQRLEACSLVVSYNNKCFDWPLLRTRFIMNRLKPPPERPHLDLLFASRRAFRTRMDAYRLDDIESRVLARAVKLHLSPRLVRHPRRH